MRTEIQTGVSNGEWIEVTNRRVRSSPDGSTRTWVPFDGSEQVIIGDLSILADGGPVNVEKADAKDALRRRLPRLAAGLPAFEEVTRHEHEDGARPIVPGRERMRRKAGPTGRFRLILTTPTNR